MPLHGIFLTIPITAQDLNSFHRGPHGGIRGVHLCHGCRFFIRLLVILQPCRPQGEEFGRVQLCRHVCQFPLNGLERRYGFAKLFPCLGIRHRFLKHGPPDPHGLGGNAYPPAIKCGEHLPEAPALLPQEGICRDPGVFKYQFGGSRGTDTQLFLHPAHLKPRGVIKVQHKRADPLVPFSFFRNRSDYTVGCHIAVGDKFFLAVHDPSISISHGGRPHTGRV